MNKILILICCTSMVCSIACTDDILSLKTCSGTLFIGVISDRQYCISNQTMDW